MELAQKTEQGMQGITKSSNDVNQIIGEIKDQMDKISEIVNLITDLANQTNLLSLNAAIEAEKAGQYGLGFSVVAQEIRRLAEQTAIATLEIEAMIGELRSTVSDGVAAVGRYTGQARENSEKVVHISERLGRLIEQTGQLGAQFGDVNEGMQVQSQSATQISEAMNQLNETARLTKTALVGFKKITEQLNDTVSGLQGEISRFATR